MRQAEALMRTQSRARLTAASIIRPPVDVSNSQRRAGRPAYSRPSQRRRESVVASSCSARETRCSSASRPLIARFGGAVRSDAGVVFGRDAAATVDARQSAASSRAAAASVVCWSAIVAGAGAGPSTPFSLGDI